MGIRGAMRIHCRVILGALALGGCGRAMAPDSKVPDAPSTCDQVEDPGHDEPRFRIELQATLGATPAAVFPHLHDPEHLRWLGRFRLTRRSDDPTHPSGVGSVRRVTVFVPIVEETIVCFEPPYALDYAVTYSRAYANHHAAIRLSSPDGVRTQLHWVIGFDSKRRNGSAHARFTERYLERALERLQRSLE